MSSERKCRFVEHVRGECGGYQSQEKNESIQFQCKQKEQLLRSTTRHAHVIDSGTYLACFEIPFLWSVVKVCGQNSLAPCARAGHRCAGCDKGWVGIIPFNVKYLLAVVFHRTIHACLLALVAVARRGVMPRCRKARPECWMLHEFLIMLGWCVWRFKILMASMVR